MTINSVAVLPRFISHLLYGALIAMPLVVQAQPEASPDVASSIFGEDTQASIGIGVAVAPRYMGSKDYHPTPVPVLSLNRGIFFVDTTRGVGVQWQSSSGFFISQSFFYDAGRVDRDSNFRPGSKQLSGMGEVNSIATSTLLMGQQLTPWLSVSSEVEFGLDGHRRGTRHRTGIEATVLNQSKDTVTVGFDVRSADRRYNQTYFGVTEQQAQRSRFASFTPGGGLNQYALNTTWIHKFDDHWSTLVLISASQLAGKVEDSPLVERRTAVMAASSVNYTF